MATAPRMAKDSTWTRFVGAVVAIVAVASGAVSIKSYFDHNPTYDISGRWTIENTIERTSYHSYEGARMTFTVAFTQTGAEFNGVGEKTTAAGRFLSGNEHAPIKIQGTLSGGKIHATFIEQGVKRETSGVFSWEISSDRSVWVGTFSSTAANTSGTSVLKRLN